MQHKSKLIQQIPLFQVRSMMCMDILKTFVSNLMHYTVQNLNSRDYEMAKNVLADYIAVSACGFRQNKEKIMSLMNHFGHNREGFTVIGYDKKTDMLSALLINGISSHILELDDGERYGQIHLGSPIISALLSVAENRNVSGKKLLESIILSYEAGIRLSRSFQPNHTLNGFHATATFGSAAASIGVSYLLNLDLNNMTQALKNALISGVGFLKVIDGNSEIKPMNVSNASIRGVLSVFVTISGFQAPEDILNGAYGYENTVSSIINSNYLTDFSEKLFHSIYIKKYPSCRHTHAAIEATQKIMEFNDISVEKISKIVVYTYNYVIGKHDHKQVLNSNSAKMSLPYSVALQILFRDVSLDMFSRDFYENRQVTKLMDLIKVIEKNEYNDMVPKIRPASVEIYIKDGNHFSEEVYFPKGEPENPMCYADIKEKFFRLMKIAKYSDARMELIHNTIYNLDINDVNDLYRVIGNDYHD